ncbi:MAG: transporter substrate-binding domain-containing protein [bacterium]
MPRLYFIIRTIPLLIALIALQFGCSARAEKRADLEEILQNRTLRVGTEAGYIPFEMRNKNGDYIGFDVEMAAALAENLGVPLQIVNMGAEGLIPGLLTDKFDLLIAGVTITPERAKTVQFSDPYFTTGLTALLANKHKGRITRVEQLNDPKFVLTTVAGTTGDIVVKTQLPKATRRQMENATDATNEVRLGKADGFVFDQPFLMILARKYADQVFALEKPFKQENFGVVMRQGRPELLNRVNTFIKTWKASGNWKQLYQKYFVTMEWLKDVNL